MKALEMDTQPDVLDNSQCPSEMQGRTIGCCWEVCDEEDVMKLQKQKMLCNTVFIPWTAECYLWVSIGLGSLPA